MPRPKLKTDEEVLAAARAVLKRRGPLDFSLSEVAEAVGLSRAALIQRFQSREELLLRVMEHAVALTEQHLRALPHGPRDVEQLWAFLQALVRGMDQSGDFSLHLLISWYELQVPALHALAERRQQLVLAALKARLPKGAPKDAHQLLQAVIAGATLQWLVHREGALAEEVLARLATTLRLLFPQHRLRVQG